jgi:hypothetical protein
MRRARTIGRTAARAGLEPIEAPGGSWAAIFSLALDVAEPYAGRRCRLRPAASRVV